MKTHALVWHPYSVPFRHWVADGFFDTEELREVAESFPDPGDSCWKTYTMKREAGKQECDNPEYWPDGANEILDFFSDESWLLRLEELTGIPMLTCDFDGGGMHQTPKGGKLDLHVDFNRHPKVDWMDRRLNLLLFLNENATAHGVAPLELQNPEGDHKVIPAEMNRLVLFETNDTTFHGHPEPTWGTRRSLAAYFYTPALGEDRAPCHTTRYLED